jgi:hypothetical protein
MGNTAFWDVIAGRLVYIFRIFGRNYFGGRFFRNVGVVILNYHGFTFLKSAFLSAAHRP